MSVTVTMRSGYCARYVTLQPVQGFASRSWYLRAIDDNGAVHNVETSPTFASAEAAFLWLEENGLRIWVSSDRRPSAYVSAGGSVQPVL